MSRNKRGEIWDTLILVFAIIILVVVAVNVNKKYDTYKAQIGEYQIETIKLVRDQKILNFQLNQYLDIIIDTALLEAAKSGLVNSCGAYHGTNLWNTIEKTCTPKSLSHISESFREKLITEIKNNKFSFTINPDIKIILDNANPVLFTFTLETNTIKSNNAILSSKLINLKKIKSLNDYSLIVAQLKLIAKKCSGKPKNLCVASELQNYRESEKAGQNNLIWTITDPDHSDTIIAFEVESKYRVITKNLKLSKILYRFAYDFT